MLVFNNNCTDSQYCNAVFFIVLQWVNHIVFKMHIIKFDTESSSLKQRMSAEE